MSNYTVHTEPAVDDEIEGFFENVGMGRSVDGSFDLNLAREETPTCSTPSRPPHDVSRVEVCDDGIVDTIVTGGVSAPPY